MKERISLFGQERIEWRRLRGRAAAAVHAAVKRGDLPNLKKKKIPCQDCGDQATVYDHRDYNRPLDVMPVCHGCNVTRGTNAPTKPVNNGKPRCKHCNSGQVYYRMRTEDYVCRQCGNLTTKKEINPNGN